MRFQWIVLAVVFGVVFGRDGCPPQEDILPCTCDGEGVNCMEAKSLAEIKNAFNANFKYGATRAVWVQATPITSLTADLFGKIKGQMFYVEINNITTVDLNAFRASKKSMRLLSLFGNKIEDFPFSDLKDFEMLQTLNMGRNLIHTLPDNAFQSRSLWSIVLAQNKIRSIGRNAFANLPALGKLELSYNQLVALGPYALASKQHGGGIQMSVVANRIAEIDDTAFEGIDPYAIYFGGNQLKTLKKEVFEPLVQKAANQGGFLEVSQNPLTCKSCDFRWIALNKQALASKLLGFRCEDGTTIETLDKDRLGC